MTEPPIGTEPLAGNEATSGLTHRVHPLVVLIGPPAAGKSRIGKRIARSLDVPFFDTDREIVAVHGPIPQIFAEHGEAVFRQWEREAVVAALQLPAVVALGGGAVMTPATAADLADQPVVLLTITAEAAARRLDSTSRPLVAGGVQQWTDLVARRMPTYQRLARASWDSSRRPADTIAAEIADWIRAGAPDRKDTP